LIVSRQPGAALGDQLLDLIFADPVVLLGIQRGEAHLSSTQPVAPAGQHFKADDKPVLGRQQSFKEAVETSEMSEQQRQRLLSL